MVCSCFSKQEVAHPEAAEPSDEAPTLLGRQKVVHARSDKSGKKGNPWSLCSSDSASTVTAIPAWSSNADLSSAAEHSLESLLEELEQDVPDERSAFVTEPSHEDLEQAVPDEQSNRQNAEPSRCSVSRFQMDQEIEVSLVPDRPCLRTRRSQHWAKMGLAWTTKGDSVFTGQPEQVPAIGGCVDLREGAHSEWLLPPEVLLFEPSKQEIFPNMHLAKDPAHAAGRQIFLNTPLLQHEVDALHKFRKAMPNGEFPSYMGLNALRMLHVNKFDQKKTLDMMDVMLQKRVRYLPVAEADVLQDLSNGFMYWHGRDRMCRPCLVIRLARMGEMANDKERAVKLTLFVLEYALRFAMVPGRVENWVVLLDLQNVLSVISIFHISSLLSTAQALATALEKVYCGRMAWMKIVNMPGNSIITKAVNASIPAEKKHKVQFPTPNEMESGLLLEYFQANQLEKRYGGTAPNLDPAETYPFHFFHGATNSVAASCERSLHETCPLEMHVGSLWDPDSKKYWLPTALRASLTPDSAKALTALSSIHVRACRDIAHWHEICGKLKMDSDMNDALWRGSSISSVRGFLSGLLPWFHNQGKSDLARRKSAR
eukprot:TRINITY_DN36748_c0_g1_i1.p1 TRINITY_DN36748_c0_g1~~TRINITY_DN36748_c0_g1_i1.p1  ORF type:complete len:598 (-),score=123.51 TRINITY_DN36748_c0_g1_i1:425-2218(-)